MVGSRFKEAIRNSCVDPFGASLCWKDSPSPPAPPDYIGAAGAQGAANEAAARVSGRISNPWVVNPYGTQKVFYNDQNYADVPSVVQELTPAGQQLFNTNQEINTKLGDTAKTGLGYVQDTLNKPFNWGALPASPVGPGQTYTQAAMSRLQPQMNMERDMLNTQLSNQGISQSSNATAYGNAMRGQNQRENDQLSSVIGSSIGQDQAYRQAALQEQEFGRTEPLNILNAVRSSAPVGLPQFQNYNGTNAQAAPILQGAMAQGQANQGLYNAQVGQSNAQNQGLYSLAGSAASAAIPFLLSDVRFKRDLERIGTHPKGFGIYKFRYIFEDTPYIGVIAQEVQPIVPEAVRDMGGYLAVNYGLI